MTTKDRLPDLHRLCAPVGGAVYGDTVEAVEAVEASPPATCPPHIEHIFREVERMRLWVLEVERSTQLVRRLHADPTFHTNTQLQEQLEAAAERARGAAAAVCAALRSLEDRATSGNEGAGVGAGAGVGVGVGARIARLQYACTRRLLTDALAAHHAALDAVRDSHLALLQRQIHLTNLTISDEECQSLLDSNNLSLFVDNVQAETAEARRALREVSARREELARVEDALRHVRDLFLQLAALVAAQQEQLDSVEYFALQASDHVGGGGQHLLKGTVSRKKANKKKISLIICVSAGLTIVLMVLVLT